jgi:hypothetical protein
MAKTEPTMPKTHIITMTLEKPTKNTVRFEEDLPSAMTLPLLRNIYLSKHAFDGNIPQKIRITIERAE